MFKSRNNFSTYLYQTNKTHKNPEPTSFSNSKCPKPGTKLPEDCPPPTCAERWSIPIRRKRSIGSCDLCRKKSHGKFRWKPSVKEKTDLFWSVVEPPLLKKARQIGCIGSSSPRFLRIGLKKRQYLKPPLRESFCWS